MPNIGLIRSLEPFNKFLVGGGGARDYNEEPGIIWWSTVSLAFYFGPKLWFWTWTKLNNLLSAKSINILHPFNYTQNHFSFPKHNFTSNWYSNIPIKPFQHLKQQFNHDTDGGIYY